MTTENTKTQSDIAKVKLQNVRLSFPHLFVPKANDEGGKPKYSADLILDKKQHAETIKKIDVFIQRVALDFFKKKVTLKHAALHDGTEREDKDGGYKDGYGEDVMYVVAKNDQQPPIVDRDPSVTLTAADRRPYGGCYVNAVIRLFAYDHKTGGKGVSASLEAVQFYKDGKSFGAGPVDAEEEFEKIADEADGY